MADVQSNKLQFTTSSKAGVTSVWWVPPDVKKNEGCSVPVRQAPFEYSPDGTQLAIRTAPTTLSVFNPNTNKVLITINTTAEIKNVGFSPRNTLVITEEKRLSADFKNVKIWSTETGSLLTEWVWGGEVWPPIQWSSDESLSCRLVKSGLLFYKDNKFDEVEKRFEMEHIGAFAIGPGNKLPYKLAIFLPELKGGPGFIRVFHYPSFDAPVASKTFFKAQSGEIEWNSSGTALLIRTQTQDDRSNKSYYGETGLYYLQADGQLDCRVPLKQEGPIHMVRWSPSGNEFAVVYGDMPASTTIFDNKCRIKVNLPPAARNKVLWSPCGRLLLVGGFASLSGDVDIWKWADKLKVGFFQAFCSSYQEWSPDGQYILTSILFSRMKVDNGIKIFSYHGELVHKEEISELFKAVWQPGQFPEKPIIIKDLPQVSNESSPVSAGAYKHPNFGKGQGGVALDTTPPVKKVFTISGSGAVPGGTKKGEPLTKAAKRNKRKNKKKKAAQMNVNSPSAKK